MRNEWAEDHGYVRVRCPICGKRDWSDSGFPECGCREANDRADAEVKAGARCFECRGTEDECNCTQGFKVRTFRKVGPYRVARRDHKDGFIKKGDTYRVKVQGGYYKDGPRWLESVAYKIIRRAS